MDIAELAASTEAAFRLVHEEVFRGDPVANASLRVEVVDPEVVRNVATLVLITPWTLNGMIFCEDRPFPETLRVGPRELPVFDNTLEAIGRYRSVNLVSDVSRIDSPDAARRLAASLGGDFRKAVARALDEAEVPDPDRRRLLGRG